MKPSLLVLTSGKMHGKTIAVNLAQFLIGRDPQCHLRPASPLISNRHCALITRGPQLLVRDFGSTNGTFVNDEPIAGERVLRHGDRLRVGPIEFQIHWQPEKAAGWAAPSPALVDDEQAAALLLATQGDDLATDAPGNDADVVPMGTTVLEALPPTSATAPADGQEKQPAKSPAQPRQPARDTKPGDTSTAATDLLQKYLRRPRSPS